MSVVSRPKLSQEDALRMAEDPCFFGETLLDWHPHEAQRQFMSCNTRILVGCFGRQSGKSMSMAVLLLHKALFYEDSRQAVVSGTYKNASVIFEKLKYFVDHSSDISEQVVSIKQTPYPQILFRNGSQISVATTGNDGAHLRGDTLDRIVVDEAAFIDDDIVDSVLRPMLGVKQGQLILISTPFNRNYFYRYYEEGLHDETGMVKSFHFTTYDNPYFKAEELEWIKKNTPELKFRTEYLAEFMDESAFVFPWSAIEPCLTDEPLTLARAPGRSYVMGVDIARIRDFSTICVLDVTDPLHVPVVWFERFNESTVKVKDYWQYCATRIVQVSNVFAPTKVVMDSSSAGNPILEWVRPEIPQVEDYAFSNSKSNPKKVLLVNQLVLGFQQLRVGLPRAADQLVEELKYFEYRVTEEQNLQMMASQGHHDDCVIALALAWSCVAAPVGDVSVTLIDRKKINTEPVSDMIVLGGGSGSSGNPFRDAGSGFGVWREWGSRDWT